MEASNHQTPAEKYLKERLRRDMLAFFVGVPALAAACVNGYQAVDDYEAFKDAQSAAITAEQQGHAQQATDTTAEADKYMGEAIYNGLLSGAGVVITAVVAYAAREREFKSSGPYTY